MPVLPPASPLSANWGLDPSVVHLNHGSFGACPREVLDAQRRHIERMEADAVRFFVDDVWTLLDTSRAALAPILGCRGEDLVFVPNATHGVHSVLHNLDLRAGDEILSNTHEYPACLNMIRDVCRRTGAVHASPELPWPRPKAESLTDAILGRVTPRTRVCLLSRITSPTAIVMPVERLVPALRARGVEVLLDGAHAAGYCDNRLADWGVAWATGNAHKWLCAPKGAAWLYVRSDLQEGFRPPVLSVYAETAQAFARDHGRSAFGVEFDYVGTRDVSAALAIADAVGFLERLAGSMGAYAARNRALALAGRDAVCRRLGVEPSLGDELTGAMACIDLPPAPAGAAAPRSIWLDPLKERLIDRWRIQVPIWAPRAGVGAAGARAVRISANLYNTIEQYEYLGEALAAELRAERR